jgi:predicted nucleic acid-binding Zn ribbon protein
VSGYKEDDNERLDDPEGLDDHDVDDSDSVDTEPCRHCGKQISEYAEVCPYCGNYVSREDAPRRKSPWVVICVAVLLIVIVVCWVLTKPQP